MSNTSGTMHAEKPSHAKDKRSKASTSTQNLNPLTQLSQQGQSVWLDFIRRDLIKSGKLEQMIAEDGVSGVTSNPTIFQQSISSGSDYQDFLHQLSPEERCDAKARYELLAIRDIQDAADLLLPVYRNTDARDGYVSLEVSPHLAHDSQSTIAEARRLWQAIARPNAMIKVPGTTEGIPALEQLIGEGINVNVTLLFSQSVYVQVAEAYLRGLERRKDATGDLHHVASVASFFVSRIDRLVSSIAEASLKGEPNGARAEALNSVLGKVAIANAKLAYQRYLRIFSGPRWQSLQSKGARPQRVLWASTSTKDPNQRDVVYVEELIGPDTVNTIPPNTLSAFREHGRVQNTLTADIAGAEWTMQQLKFAGISIEEVARKLEDDGVRLFTEAFDKLLDTLKQHGDGK